MIEHISDFWKSQTSRLMLVYLAIIMVMSVGFSVVIYIASAEQLDRQLPGQGYIDENGTFTPPERVGSYLRGTVADSKETIIQRLYVLNMIMLIFGTAFSYILARWTLEPIERNVEAQSRFISDASHELRTPLTAIQVSNEVALRKPRLTAQAARKVIQSNLEDITRLQNMTSTMLELVTEGVPIKKWPTRIHDIVSQSLTAVAPQAIERNIEIVDETKNELVGSDDSLAAQALTILLDNAVKYSPDGGTVRITTSKIRRGMWEIAVHDKGPGIAKEEQKKVFSRFYRSDSSRQHGKNAGYGLGLEIASRIAERHGGSIDLQSRLGEGSVFSLVLPAASEKISSAQSGASRARKK